jgi:hypothetical protein
MNTPTWLEPRCSELLEIECETSCNKRLWVVVLGLKPIIDGDQYCFLWGNNLQDGVAAFGDTPLQAMNNFDIEMYKSIKRGQK